MRMGGVDKGLQTFKNALEQPTPHSLPYAYLLVVPCDSPLLHSSLNDYLATGGRRIDTWMRQHTLVEVPFNIPADEPQSFFNVNTLAQLHPLEQQ